MTKQELLKILATLETAYPHFYQGGNRDNVANLWFVQFKEYEYKEVICAVHSFISNDTRGFPPVIGQIKEAMYKNENNHEMSELEAWNILYKAICNSGYHATEEFEKLPPVIKSIVSNPERLKEWGMMPTDTVNSVVASNFQRSYRARKKSFQENSLIPIAVKKALGIEMENVENDKQSRIDWKND